MPVRPDELRREQRVVAHVRPDVDADVTCASRARNASVTCGSHTPDAVRTRPAMSPVSTVSFRPPTRLEPWMQVVDERPRERAIERGARRPRGYEPRETDDALGEAGTTAESVDEPVRTRARTARGRSADGRSQGFLDRVDDALSGAAVDITDDLACRATPLLGELSGAGESALDPRDHLLEALGRETRRSRRDPGSARRSRSSPPTTRRGARLRRRGRTRPAGR